MKGCSSRDPFDFVIPASIQANHKVMGMYDNLMRNVSEIYGEMVNCFDIPAEDARYILPNACCTNMLMTMNLRELKHFMELRLCQRAQWEIRELAEQMKDCLEFELHELSEIIKWVPQCERLGYCPESRGCGKYAGKKQ